MNNNNDNDINPIITPFLLHSLTLIPSHSCNKKPVVVSVHLISTSSSMTVTKKTPTDDLAPHPPKAQSYTRFHVHYFHRR